MRAAARKGAATYYFTEGEGRLAIGVDGDVAMLRAHLVGMDPPREARVPYARLLEVWEAFCRTVRAYLDREVLQLCAHAFWGAWLSGTDYEDIPGPPWRVT